MHKVFHNSRQQGHEYHSFKKEMIKICSKHRKAGRAFAFAFILYDEETPEINGVVNDQVYWKALNNISGKFITVFTIHYKERRRIRANSSSHKPKPMEYLTNINVFAPLRESNYDILSSFFGSKKQLKTPGILFFQVDEDNISDYFYINLAEREKEKAFNEIKDYLTRVAQTFSQIHTKNKDNSVEIFSLLKTDIKNLKTVKSVTSKLPVIRTIGQLIGIIT